jgi:hypothetical protein
MPDNPPITISKLDAARRQLRTAIRLWFADGDPVSIHTLAFAAYGIAHVVSKKQDQARKALIFDTLHIKEENRAFWNITLKKHANFFKHAKNDWNISIQLAPTLSVLFMMGASAGLRLTQQRRSPEEFALMFWLFLHNPEFVTPTAKKFFKDRIPIKHFAKFKTIPKRRFLQALTEARKKR